MSACRCNCGYRCGGPGRCPLGALECIAQETGHFERDCEHDWTGPAYSDEAMSSATCAKCGMLAINHDIRFGP